MITANVLCVLFRNQRNFRAQVSVTLTTGRECYCIIKYNSQSGSNMQMTPESIKPQTELLGEGRRKQTCTFIEKTVNGSSFTQRFYISKRVNNLFLHRTFTEPLKRETN